MSAVDATFVPDTSRRARFALFAESLLTGVWLILAALPLVTALPAVAAGCAHLRRQLDHEPSGLRQFLADCRAASRTGRRVTLSWTAALPLLAVDAFLAGSGLPGGPVLLLASVTGLGLLLVLGLRTAATWRPGADWDTLARAAARRTVGDASGSLLLTGGVLVVLVSAWQLPPLVAPAAGCLALAAVAVERRYAARGDSAAHVTPPP